MNGGFIGGDWYRPANAPESLLGERDVLVWGYLIVGRFDSEAVTQKMFRSLCTSFTICYATRKSDKGYIVCRIWGDEDVAHIASGLEKGDWVFAAGKLKKTKYTVRQGPEEGKEKTILTLEPSILIPMPLVESLMAVAYSKRIAAIVQGEEEDKGSDTIESIDDYAEVEETEGEFDYQLSI